MRETCCIEGMTPDEFLASAPTEIVLLVEEIRRQKKESIRPKPSDVLLDNSKLLTTEQRSTLLDKVAELVDENCCGRSEMCIQFANLLQKALTCLGINCRIATGTTAYYDSTGKEIYRWPKDGHQWLVVGDEIIDGNLDSLSENPYVPREVLPRPYWGTKRETPRDRKYYENPGARTEPPDPDVENKWWPDLQTWIDQNIKKII